MDKNQGPERFEAGIGYEANIASQISRLEKQSHMLGDAIARTEVRLSPVLRPGPPVLASEEDTDDSSPMSDVANSLSRINRELQRHFDDLTAIVDRSEA